MRRYPTFWSLLLCLFALSGCATLLEGQTMDDEHPVARHSVLQRETVERLFDEATIVHVEEAVEHIYFFCIFSEGTQCYYMPRDRVEGYDFGYNPDIEVEPNRIERELGVQIVTELDPKSVDRAKNNTVLLHCQRDVSGSLSCLMNGGNAPIWERVPIR